ncbi:lef-4 [Spodoptera litura granulovirus]|uniref:Lef-4 n=1 Tax=Spodoptera litura granulovirus TaxID=359919 RepID=A5IZT8_9BBAC|nr:lef-4 [Spodoptera litura granulovirus]ABQ52029.1 lef-4 [Spodoptera litura granulovirus]
MQKLVMDEYEISYTLTYPQDLLYNIKKFLDANFKIKENYVEIIDANGVRSRCANDGTIMNCIKKRTIDLKRTVVLASSVFIPLIDRHCVEEIHERGSDVVHKICNTRVYCDNDDVEIKFEHVYYEHNDGDLLDPLMAAKQTALHNLLTRDKIIDATTNSHLGSDEILANCRIELEYNTGQLNRLLLLKIASVVLQLENVVKDVIIEPFLQHTTIFNEIVYRPFHSEHLMDEVQENDVAYWALKLDGIRGKAYIVNGRKIYIQLDDMQQFSGEISQDFGQNKILALQVEFMEELQTFYITDILCVYKFQYDNRNQFDKSIPYTVELQDAISYMNTNASVELCFKHFIIKFQHYDTQKPLEKSIPNDGYVIVTKNGSLAKVKYEKTFEMQYLGDNIFMSSFGTFHGDGRHYTKNSIYEVVIRDSDKISVIKHRPDRMIYN